MDNNPLTEYAQSLIEIMPEVIRGLWKRQINELASGIITPPQIFLLIYLNKIGAARMTDAARYLSITTAAATGLVDRLVKGGYVGREYDPADRRIIKVKLTAKGQKLVDKILVQKVARIKETFGKISERDRQEYLRILTNIKDILEQEQ